MELVVRALLRQIVLIGGVLPGLGGDGDVALRLGVGDLDVVGQQILGEQPRGQHLLGIVLVEHAHRRPLGDHLRMVGVELGHRHHRRLEVHIFVGADVAQRRVGAHPGGAGSGIHRKQALARVQEVGGVAGDLEGGERAVGGMGRDTVQQCLGGVVEDLHLAAVGGVARALLAQHLDHHVVRGLVDEGQQHLLPVDGEGAVGVFGGGRRIGHFPHKVPRQRLRQLIAQRLHIRLIHIARLGGAHERHGVVTAGEAALLQKLGDHLLQRGGVVFQGAAAQPVLHIGEQGVQRRHHIGAGEVGGDVVRVGDAHVGGGIGGDVGDDIVVDLAVVGVQPQLHRDVGIQRLKIVDGLVVDVHLRLIGVVLGPERDLVLPGLVKAVRHGEGVLPAGAVAAAQRQQREQRQQQRGEPHFFHHPLVPPLETPSMTLLRNRRNSTISGTEMTTTAAIMAGIFSRPKPFSRMA